MFYSYLMAQNKARRDHTGIAVREGTRDPKDLECDSLDVSYPGFVGRRCGSCGMRVMFVRGTTTRRGVHRKGHWQHVGDGLRQFRSWGTR